MKSAFSALMTMVLIPGSVVAGQDDHVGHRSVSTSRARRRSGRRTEPPLGPSS
jgi:hypothetical protein